MSDAIEQLRQLTHSLLDDQTGDPWIKAQDFDSLSTLTIEESYELADSIEHGDEVAIKSELSDLLLHITLYAEFAKTFNLNDIAQAAIAKQNRRKVNVTKGEPLTAEQALAQWEANKHQERLADKTSLSFLDGVASTLPVINKALKLQVFAAQAGFDWPDAQGVFKKLEEEMHELNEASTQQDRTKLTDELGDVLFTCINLSRKLGIEPEQALRKANQKFERRFRAMEQTASSKEAFANLDLEQQEALWNRVKQQEQS